MPDTPSTNRQMFWRILRRLLTANPARLSIILLGLGAGATITAALLNLQIDARRRLTSEFRAFGANAIVTPRNPENSSTESNTLASSVLEQIPPVNGADQVAKSGMLYLLARAQVLDRQLKPKAATPFVPLVIVGYDSPWKSMEKVIPNKTVQESELSFLDIEECQLGEKTALALNVSLMDLLELKAESRSLFCFVSGIRSFGGPEDNQIFLPLAYLQYKTGSTDKLSTILLNVPGNSSQIDRYVATLQKKLPDADVRPIRQFTEGEAKIYNRISGLLTFTVALVLVLTALCVMAAMTNVAMERRNDVGLMKALGGATRRIVRLFFVEAALLGLTAGLLGAAGGILLSIGLGKAVFGLAARPRLIVYPISVALTILVALASSYPLRRLGAVRPASIFRGEA